MLSWFKDKRNIRRFGRWCGWAALVLLLFTLLTGYGISEFRIVTGATLGVLNKAVSQRWHHYTDVPLFVFVLVHAAVVVWGRLRMRKERSCGK
jgi:thiosulfate reductase cytochrome b subunit